MEELFYDEDDLRPKAGNDLFFSQVYSDYYRERNPGTRFKVTPGLFSQANTWCKKSGVKPQFLVHAVFNFQVAKSPTIFSFQDKRVYLMYEQWAERIPAELQGQDLVSPFTPDIHREIETMVSMIITKYGSINFNDHGFKIACADPVFDVTPCSRVVLSDASDIVLEYWGRDYLEWSATNPWKAGVLEDFGMDHQQIEGRIKNGGT